MAPRTCTASPTPARLSAGQYQGLLDPAIMARKAESERELRARIAGDAAKQKAYGSAWDADRRGGEGPGDFRARVPLAGARRRLRFRAVPHRPAPGPAGGGAAEADSPDRLREYRDSNLESLEFQLFSPAPIHAELERASLAGSLSFLAENLGGEHPLVLKVLAGKSPAARAVELINGSKLADPAERKRLAAGGKRGHRGIGRSADPVGPADRSGCPGLRKRYEDQVEEPERQANALIARARFELLGGGRRPGCDLHARGWRSASSRATRSMAWTCRSTRPSAAAFARADQQGHRDPFILPDAGSKARDKLD